MGDMSYREISNWLAESEEAQGELRVKYKTSLAKRRELAEQLYELSKNSSSEEANIDALANEVEKMNDEKSNLRRELEALTIQMSYELEARRASEDKIREKDHEIFKLNQEIDLVTKAERRNKSKSQSVQDETKEILKKFLGLVPEEEEPERTKGEELPEKLNIDDIIPDEIWFDDTTVDTHTKQETIIITDEETVLPKDISINKDKDTGEEEKDNDVEEIETEENVQIDDVQKEEMQKNIDVEQSTGQPVNTKEMQKESGQINVEQLVNTNAEETKEPSVKTYEK
ncbi:uncharacterized protein LOC131858744 [Cryptomeria japonica]|uniref:uncharacterized protein LOC131858744 n=1 Tax=Cryptomeria japonica TaxID=3369 RepID=UPI0027DA5F0A|nr:uncharacterized protein LOC131858744 [Cryptomeria japonica]